MYYTKELVQEPLQERLTKEKRAEYQYDIILKYLKNKLKGWNIAFFFEQRVKTRIALYAITDFTQMVCEDIKYSLKEIEFVYICDKNYLKFKDGFCDKNVVGIKNLLNDYQEKKIDMILVCSIFHANEIIMNLIKYGVAQDDIVSITSVIFSVE